MKKQLIVLTLAAMAVTSCGKLDTPIHSPVTKDTNRDQPSEIGDSPDNISDIPMTPEVPLEPPPTNDTETFESQVCFLQTTKGQTCFDVHDRDDINRAEPKYRYVDSFNDPSFPSGMDKWQYRAPVNLLFSSQHMLSAPLAENFSRGEMLNSDDNRGHYGFFSPVVLQKIQQMRNEFGRAITINSGYRSPYYNASLPGAAKFSRHTFGDGIDFKISGVSFQQIAQKCLDLGAGYYQIYANHIHCDWRTTPLNETVYGEDQRRGIVTQQNHLDVIQSLSSQIQIDSKIHAREFSTKSNLKPVQLTASHLDLEDGEGAVWYWEVSQNDRVLNISDLPNPIFQLSPGTYQVLLNVGGSLEKTSTINVR